MIESKAPALAAPQVFTDLNSLASLRTGDANAQIDKVARQFEGIMLQMMMKSMRDANAVFSEGNPLSSSESQFYQEMFDHQLSLTLAQQGGLGLADVLKRQLGATSMGSAGSPGSVGSTGLTGSTDPAGAQAGALDIASLQRLTGTPQRAPLLHDNPLIDRLLAQLPAIPQSAKPEVAATPADLAASPADFVATVAPLAEQAAAALGVDSRVLVSQAALETGWGRKILQRADGSSSYNFFNIKAGKSWRGPVVNVPTLEYRNGVAAREVAAFRAYATPAEGFADYVRLIQESPRYQQALQRAGNPGQYMQALAEAGYATDPAYAEKVMQVHATEHIQGAGQ